MLAHGLTLLARGVRAALIKYGHARLSQAADRLLTPAGAQPFARDWGRGGRCRGTGCTLSSTMAAAVRGASLSDSVAQAKARLIERIRLGYGSVTGFRKLVAFKVLLATARREPYVAAAVVSPCFTLSFSRCR
jgi:hydroxymethylpyrimidine/phosphomethylpyrimidine kinase